MAELVGQHFWPCSLSAHRSQNHSCLWLKCRIASQPFQLLMVQDLWGLTSLLLSEPEQCPLTVLFSVTPNVSADTSDRVIASWFINALWRAEIKLPAAPVQIKNTFSAQKQENNFMCVSDHLIWYISLSDNKQDQKASTTRNADKSASIVTWKQAPFQGQNSRG